MERKIGDTAVPEILGKPVGVNQELEKEKDDLYNWCKDREDILIWEPNEFTVAFYSELVNTDSIFGVSG